MRTLLTLTVGLVAALSGVAVDAVPGSRAVADNMSPVPIAKCNPRANYPVSIERLDVSPNPIRLGAPLSATFTGFVGRDIVMGTKVHINGRVGFLSRSIDLDFCDTARRIGMSCPIPAGPVALNIQQMLPSLMVPSITPHITISAVAPDGVELFCFSSQLSITS